MESIEFCNFTSVFFSSIMNGKEAVRCRNGKKGFGFFGVNLMISTFTFGGGYIVIPMIRKIFVQQKQFFTEAELLEMAAIAQSSPGAIAVNCSVLAGRRTMGLAGALISALGASAFVCHPRADFLVL